MEKIVATTGSFIGDTELVFGIQNVRRKTGFHFYTEVQFRVLMKQPWWKPLLRKFLEQLGRKKDGKNLITRIKDQGA